MLEAQQKFVNKFENIEMVDEERKLPEIKIDLKKADIFSLGVILFEMVVGRSPFLNANAQDGCYRYFYFKKRCSLFWQIHPKAKDLDAQGLLSKEFKSLIEEILTPFPKSRPTIDELENHPWMQL